MLGLYDFDICDVFTGKAPIRKAKAYLDRLPFEPMSMWRAKQLGSLEHMGWTPDTYRLADLTDSVNVLVTMVANFGSKNPADAPEPVYRPGLDEELKTHKEPATPTVPTLDDFNIDQLTALARRIGGGLEDGD